MPVKGKVHLITGHEGTEGEQTYSSTLSLTLALDGGVWSTPRPGRFSSCKDPVPIVQEAGLAPGTVWVGEENLAPTGVRTPNRPSRSDSLHAGRSLPKNSSHCESLKTYLMKMCIGLVDNYRFFYVTIKNLATVRNLVDRVSKLAKSRLY